MSKVKIIVAGQTCTGKSTLSMGIIEHLMNYGLNVSYNSIDHKSVEHLKSSMEHDITLNERMQVLKDKEIEIEVVEVTINNEPTVREVNKVLTNKNKEDGQYQTKVS